MSTRATPIIQRAIDHQVGSTPLGDALRAIDRQQNIQSYGLLLKSYLSQTTATSTTAVVGAPDVLIPPQNEAVTEPSSLLVSLSGSLRLDASLGAGAGSSIGFRIKLDGVAIGPDIFSSFVATGADAESSVNGTYFVPSVTVGTHTIEVDWYVTAVGAHAYSSATNPINLTVLSTRS